MRHGVYTLTRLKRMQQAHRTSAGAQKSPQACPYPSQGGKGKKEQHHHQANLCADLAWDEIAVKAQ